MYTMANIKKKNQYVKEITVLNKSFFKFCFTPKYIPLRQFY